MAGAGKKRSPSTNPMLLAQVPDPVVGRTGTVSPHFERGHSPKRRSVLLGCHGARLRAACVLSPPCPIGRTGLGNGQHHERVSCCMRLRCGLRVTSHRPQLLLLAGASGHNGEIPTLESVATRSNYVIPSPVVESGVRISERGILCLELAVGRSAAVRNNVVGWDCANLARVLANASITQWGRANRVVRLLFRGPPAG